MGNPQVRLCVKGETGFRLLRVEDEQVIMGRRSTKYLRMGQKPQLDPEISPPPLMVLFCPLVGKLLLR